LSFAIAGIFWGIAADKGNRALITSIACIAWSISSFVTGSVDSLAVLAAMRLLLGIAQSAAEPTMFSIVADYFPASKQATANSILHAGPFIGSGLSSLSIIMIA